MQMISRDLGMPIPLEIERKFLLKKRPDFRNKILRGAVKTFIEQMYLFPQNGCEFRIRKRIQSGQPVFYKTKKESISGSPSVRRETECIINALDYVYLQEFLAPKSKTIRKNRYCFVYNGQYFELDEFLEPKKLWLLEIELTEENGSVDSPPFLDIEREVTGDQKYQNYGIAMML